ncbi:MAG: hypothetical protein ACM3S1_14400 [Hyphomicrobiales bacterium]
MRWIRSKTFAVLVASLGVAAALGGSLGIVAAGVRSQPLVEGFNLAGGPLVKDTPPDAYLSCLPSGSWNSLYIWDGANQRWLHFFNPSNVPEYVNDPAVGGIQTIKRFTGVVLLMDQEVQAPNLVDAPEQACG